MKKLKNVSLCLAVLGCSSLISLASCSSSTYEYALITDVGDIDDESFNQTSWEALKDFCKENNKTYTYYRPTEDSTAAREVSIDQAVKKGAKVIVCPGYLFEDAVYDSQTKYEDVKFVLIDGQPHTSDYATYETKSNTVSIIYKEEIAGYLAGYAAVADGNTKLGFCGGMAVPAVQRYGSGYIQGANAAALSNEKTITIDYYYAGEFNATDDATAQMKSLYAAGEDTVFACGGKVYQSVVEGIKSATKTTATWIGVDVDQSSLGEKVLTSAMKGLREAVTSSLEIYSSNNWNLIGGNDYNLGLNSVLGNLDPKDYVGLPTEDSAWRFSSFTKTEYETLLTSIKNGELTIDNSVTTAPTVSSCTTVNYISAFAS